jgi:hypothetical protein
MIKHETKMTKVFIKRNDGLYQEVIRHFIKITNLATNQTTTSFDKEIYGKLFKRATVKDIGINGIETFVDENTGETITLVAIE